MFGIVAFICSVIGLILSAVVSYHVVLAAAPDYLAMWWISFILVCLGLVFQFCSAAANE